MALDLEHPFALPPEKIPGSAHDKVQVINIYF